MEWVLFRNGLWDMLRTVNDSIDKLFRPLAEEHGLTMIQMRLLMELHQNDGITIGCLAKAVSLTSGNASAMCKRLEKEGFLERVRSSDDERNVNLCLLEKGRQVIDRVEAKLEERYGALLEQWGPQNAAAVKDGFTCLNQLLDEMKTLA